MNIKLVKNLGLCSLIVGLCVLDQAVAAWVHSDPENVKNVHFRF